MRIIIKYAVIITIMASLGIFIGSIFNQKHLQQLGIPPLNEQWQPVSLPLDKTSLDYALPDNANLKTIETKSVLTLQVANINSALSQIDTISKSVKGYVVSSSSDNTANPHSNITITIPQDKYELVSQTIKQDSLKVLSENIENRVPTPSLKTKNQTYYATITVVLTVPEDSRFFVVAGNTFDNLIKLLKFSLNLTLWVAIIIVPPLTIICLVFFILKKIFKK